MGRELGAIAGDSSIVAPVGFTDRVMLAIAREPLPQPARAFGVALLAGRVRAAAAALGDAWRVAIGGSTPLGVRGQALALVLLVGVGSLAVAGGAAVGAMDLLAQNPAVTPGPTTPLPSQAPPSAMPSPSPDPSPSPSPETTPDASPTAQNPGAVETPRATVRLRTASPTATGTDDHGGGSGSGSGSSGSGSGSGGGVQTPEPSPTESDDHGGSDG
jgi:hypothetical protein